VSLSDCKHRSFLAPQRGAATALPFIPRCVVRPTLRGGPPLEILQILQYYLSMTNEQLKTGRLNAGLTQVVAATRLGVSQPYLSQLEKGERPVTGELARIALSVYRLPATAFPIPEAPPGDEVEPGALARQLAGLGYPGFAHLRPRKANPAAVVLAALVQKDLETRLVEALPWVLLTYPDLDWPWLVDKAKLQDAQNRLGFLVAIARAVAAVDPDLRTAAEQLAAVEQQLERARLVREDTLCRDSMTVAERRWLQTHRLPLARHWNLLTGLRPDQLLYAS
jgi:transcriptional regulator with XRE-family HTH domain